jgi:hypothetical protein
VAEFWLNHSNVTGVKDSFAMRHPAVYFRSDLLHVAAPENYPNRFCRVSVKAGWIVLANEFMKVNFIAPPRENVTD